MTRFAIYLFFNIIVSVFSSCVTFDEMIHNKVSVSCKHNGTIVGDEDTCTLCTRVCPDIPPEECVTIMNDLCPLQPPKPLEKCDSQLVCDYEPYCGTIIPGLEKRCMFLTQAQCIENQWLIMTMSFPPQRNLTCSEVETAYNTQNCCNEPLKSFSFQDLL